MKRISLVALIVVLVGPMFSAQASVNFYSFEILPINQSGLSVNSMNDNGDICGFNAALGEGFAVIDNTYISLPTNRNCRSINNSGQMVFERSNPVTVQDSFFYELDPVTGNYVETQIDSGFNDLVQVWDMNNSGQAVGWFNNGSGLRAFVWDKLNGFSVLPSVGAITTAYAINDVGDIAGTSSTFASQVWLLRSGQTTPESFTPCTSTAAVAGINDSGAIAGTCSTAVATSFLIDGPVTTVFQEPDFSIVFFDLNNDGTIIGRRQNNSLGIFEAVVVDVQTGVRRLLDLIVPSQTVTFSLSTIEAINNAGQIAASLIRFNPVLNVPPALEPIAPQSVLEGMPLSITLSANDIDGTTLTFSAANITTGAPDSTLATLGATLDPVSGVFTWTPGFDQAGTYEIAFTVSDDGTPLETDTQIASITVGNVNRPPVADPLGPFDLLVGETLLEQVQVSDPDGDIVDVTAVSLPVGASVDDGNFLFWIPDETQVGVFELILNIADRGVPSQSFDISIIVTVGPATLSPSELLQLIIDTVDELPNGDAVADLREEILPAVRFIERNRLRAAIRTLREFKEEVRDLREDGDITPAEATELLDLANELIDLLQTMRRS